MQYILYRYVEFNATILQDWIDNGVNYVKLVKVAVNKPYEAFELIPDSEIPDSGEEIYNIHSEDILDLVVGTDKLKFIVHEIYLEEEAP